MILKNNIKYFILCIFTGLLAACAFPRMSLFFLMWIAFVPLIFVIMRASATVVFVGGFISGFIFNAVGLYWLVPMLHFNTSSYVQAITIAGILWTYLALYWGVWSFGLYKFASSSKESKLPKFLIIVFGSCFWILLEYVRTYFLTGFPWMLIGYSQTEFKDIIQVAEFTGVYGVSFILLFCNLCFYFWLSGKNSKKYLYTALTLVIMVTLFGTYRIYKFRLLGNQEYKVALSQPNIDQYRKWNNMYKQEISSTLKNQALEIAKDAPDLVLWPETVLTEAIVGELESSYNFAKELAATTGGFNIMGCLHDESDDKSFNVVLGFGNSDDYKCIHRKNHLVIFGEFIPFRKYLGKIFDVLNQMGDIDRGNDANVFTNGEIFMGATICSENFSSDVARRFVLNGAKVLTNHTNDAWFFDSAAPYQHFAMNIFRAVENRKFVLVSANTGVSGIIDVLGGVLDKTKVSKRKILNGTFLQNNFKTFYTKVGDIFAKVCIFLTLALILFLIIKRYEESKCSNNRKKE